MKLVVFDIDGTLVRANSLEDDCYVSALHDEFGFDGVSTDWSSYQNVTDSGLLAEIFESRVSHPPTRNEIRRFRQRYEARLIAALDEHPDEGREIHGSAAFIRTFLEQPGWAIAIATGNWRRLAVHKLKRAGISCTGWPMACAEDALAREGLLELAITGSKKHYDVAAFDVIASVGDASWDARAAAALGLPFIGVGPRWFADEIGPCAARILDYEDLQAVTGLLAALPP